MKRIPTRANLQMPPEKQITTPEKLYTWAIESEQFPSIKIEYSTTEDYNAALDYLTPRYESTKKLQDLQSAHCVIPISKSQVLTKAFLEDHIVVTQSLEKQKRKC